MSRRRDNDIKAPDGYTLGGLRKVRADGTILFNRGYWGPVADADWIGEKVWVHEIWVSRDEAGNWEPEHLALEVSNPGIHIYEARCMRPPFTVVLKGADKPDARAAYRKPSTRAWVGSLAVRDP